MNVQRFCIDAAATQRAGEEWAHLLVAGDLVLLIGPLGAGKTTFAQGVGRGLGVKERITSPTFTVVRQHECRNARGIETLHHADVYRVGSLSEVDDLALGELVEESAVALVEWGDIASSLFGRNVITVTFEVDREEGRTLSVEGAIDDRAEEITEWARS